MPQKIRFWQHGVLTTKFNDFYIFKCDGQNYDNFGVSIKQNYL